MHPFYHKLNLELDTNDWRFLNYLSHTYLDHAWYPPTDTYGDTTNYKHYFLKKSKNNYSNHTIFKKISLLFQSISKHSSVDYVYNCSQISLVPGKLPPHKDIRTCAISVPLVTIIKPISWFDDEENELFTYNYSNTATLINTELNHGSLDNNIPRIFFQIGGFTESFNTVVSQLN